MKKFALLTGLLLCFGYHVDAQEKSIRGKVSSVEGEALAFAAVTLFSLPDSLHIAFGTTNRDGAYSLRYEGSGEAFLQVRHMGYVAEQRPIRLDDVSQTIDFVLKESAEVLKAAVVNARMLGARVKGDTISYNLGAYTDNTERVLRDILEKLPGLEVDENGKVKAQGVPVKILIDGKEFFFDQSQMATKNLPAEMVKSVELIHNYNDIGMLSASSAPQGITVLSIGIKDEFKDKITGVLMGAGGILNKYAGKANLFNISKNISLATLLDANNTGEMAFTMNDYISFQGGVQQLARGNKSNRFSLDAVDVPRIAFSDDVSWKQGQTPAFNLSYLHPKNKFKLNSYLIATLQKQEGETSTRRWATTDAQEAPTSVDGLSEQSRFNFVNYYLSADYQPSDRFFISNRAMFSGQDRSRTGLVSRQMATMSTMSDTLSSDENAKLFDFKNYLLSMYKTKNGSLFTLDGFYRYNKRPTDMSIASNQPFLGLPFSADPVSGYHAIQDNEQKFHELSVFGEYAQRLGSFYLKAQTGLNYQHLDLRSSLLQPLGQSEMPFIPEKDYNNSVGYNNTDLWAGLWLHRSVGILRLSLGVDAHYYAIALNDKDRQPLVKNDYWKVLPNAQLIIYLSANNRITVSTNLAQESRRMSELNEGVTATDYRTLTRGKVVDDLLNPAFNASLNYTYSNFRAGTTLLIASSYYKQSRSLAYNYVYHSNYSESTIMEAPDNSNFMSMFRLRQSLRFLPVDVRISVNYALVNHYSYINGAENEIVQHHINGDLAFMTFTKGMLNADLGGNVLWFSNQSKLTDKTMRLLTLAPFAKLRLNAGKGWSAIASVQHYKYDGNDTRRDITNVSASVVYIPPKGKFEFELNASNILNFNKTEKVTSTYSSSFFEERVIRTLPGFIMAKLTYRL